MRRRNHMKYRARTWKRLRAWVSWGEDAQLVDMHTFRCAWAFRFSRTFGPGHRRSSRFLTTRSSKAWSHGRMWFTT